jgi:hypothetical protein
MVNDGLSQRACFRLEIQKGNESFDVVSCFGEKNMQK